MWLVMLNHYDLGCMQVGLKSFVVSVDYRLWAQVREFDRFGDCFCTCALINWSVLLQEVALPAVVSAAVDMFIFGSVIILPLPPFASVCCSSPFRFHMPF